MRAPSVATDTRDRERRQRTGQKVLRRPSLTQIRVNSRQVRFIIEDAWEEMLKGNEPNPLLFVREGRVVGSFPSHVQPDDARLIASIEALL